MVLAEDTILENRYRIDGLLARGGMGAIYRAFDTNLNTPVAIKENAFLTPERVAQFKQEALFLARLRHPALPRVIHHFSVVKKQYLVMDFIEGENLWEIIERTQQPLPEAKALDYISQVCEAVSYLHQQRPPIIHRDIKPQNIKITPQGQAVLVDFGIAKEITDEKSATHAGAQAVTPGFSPPEQYNQQRTTPASDIYSLGATLYALLTAQKPPDSLILMAGKGKFQPPDKLNPKLSSRVSKAIMHAMQIEPADRPGSVTAWQKDLTAIAESLTVADEDDGPTLQVMAPLAKKKPPVSDSGLPAAASVTYWLVNAAGTGYPIGTRPQVIGRHSEADIVVEDLSVSRAHARIRIDSGRCMVMDNGSANGTFINAHRLSREWYPLNPSDLLTIGSVRFYLTTTQPAKLASSAPRPVSTSKSSQPTRRSASVARPPATPTKRGKGRLWLALILVLLVTGIGGGYWLVESGRFTGLATSAAPVTNAPVGQTPTATIEVGSTQVAAQKTDVARTAQTERTPASSPTLALTPAGLAPTVTPRSSAGDQLVRPNSSSPELTATSPTVQSTPTPNPSPTGTPTETSTEAAPVVSGPTIIPLEFDEAVEEIGAREVIDVDINPKNPKEVYALVKGDGIYKSSTNGTGPWAKLKVDAASVVALAIDPTNPARLYGPTWNAVLKSTDGGNTWEAKLDGLVANRTVDVLVIDPINPATLYGGIGETLVVSTDSGASWGSQGYGAGLGVARFNQLLVDPFNPDIILVAGLAGSVYKSTDGGRNFVQMPYNTGKGVFGLAAHPTQKDVYLAGINSSQAGIIKTVNGWDFDSVSTGLIYGGADSAYSAIAFAPSDPSVVYAGSGYEDNRNAKGIFKSTDGGENWAGINNGLSINPDTGYPFYVKAIAVHPSNADIVFAATGGGLFKSVDGGASWSLK